MHRKHEKSPDRILPCLPPDNHRLDGGSIHLADALYVPCLGYLGISGLCPDARLITPLPLPGRDVLLDTAPQLEYCYGGAGVDGIRKI